MKQLDNIFTKKAINQEDLFKIKKTPYNKSDMYQVNKLLSELLKNKKKKGNGFINCGYSSGGYGNYCNSPKQQVYFHTSFGYKINTHEQYIKNYMVQAEKTVINKPELFGTEDEIYDEKITGKHFKFIISPDSQNVDLKQLADLFINRIEKLTGHKLCWKGAIHNDTEHRHLHICINGLDMNDKDVFFPKEMIKNTMRETLSYLVTQMVGERTQEEIQKARNNQITAKRFTAIDEKISEYKGLIDYNNVDIEIQNRLSFLSKIGLAQYNEKNYYSLKKDWKETLKAAGRYISYLNEYIKNTDIPLELYDGTGAIGKVEKIINFDRDESNNDAIILNTGTKKIYIPFYQLKRDDLLNKNVYIKEGKLQIVDKDVFVTDRNTKKKRRNSRKNY